MTGVTDVREALVELRDRFDCDSAAAGFVLDDGTLVTLTVYRSFVTIADDDGHMQVLPVEGAAP